MKKILAAALLLSLSSGVALAASIVGSKHDLASTKTTGIYSTSMDQICIFCHTPHSPMGGPLWNRYTPTTDPATYILFNSSETLSSAAKAAQIDNSSASILCLSCHDGTVSEIGSRVRINLSNPMTMVDTNGTWSKSGVVWDKINTPPTRTPANHPVGFDYVFAQSQHPDKLRTADEASTLLGSTNVFFRSTQTGTGYKSMECSTCHIVHNPINPPFLRITNTNNALCLACHKDKVF